MNFDKVSQSLYKFFLMYEDLIWKDDNLSLIIIYEENTIKMLLIRNGLSVDSLEINFSNQERELYLYLSMRQFIDIFGNVMIRHDKNIFSTKGFRNYVKFIVNDIELYQIMLNILEIQEKEIINSETTIINNLLKNIPYKFFWKYANADFENRLNDRYRLSKKILSSRLK